MNKSEITEMFKGLSQDLKTNEGRIDALIEIANLCLTGVYKSVVVQKTGTVEIVPSQEPQIAINAIKLIAELSEEITDNSRINVNLTIGELTND